MFLHLPVHLIQTQAKWLIPPRLLDVLGDADALKCARGVVEHLCSLDKLSCNKTTSFLSVLGNDTDNAVALEGSDGRAELLDCRKTAELLGKMDE
ncbi:MAG: hypothetical protein JWO62_3403 [Acidimicrobiaceae bacterium]|nr:hypothetical protein [Acidimicrobiaceae bacterium]